MLPRTSAVPSFPAERGNEDVVQVVLTYDCEAIQEKVIDHLPCFAIRQLHPVGPHFLPRGNHFADDWIDGFGKCSARFIDRNIEHANGAAA